MVRVRISARERELLETGLRKYNSSNLKLKIEDNNVIIEDDIINVLEQIIEDCLLNYFTSEGLQSNDEPNELGLELESLNDKFIRELWKIND